MVVGNFASQFPFLTGSGLVNIFSMGSLNSENLAMIRREGYNLLTDYSKQASVERKVSSVSMKY